MNDNDHALGNVPSFLLADKILLPEYFPMEVAIKQLARARKIVRYPGLKEGIYLWNRQDLLYDHRDTRDSIYIRPEPWLAQYYNGEVNFLDGIIKELIGSHKLVILPRDALQEEHYVSLNLENTVILRGKLKLDQVASNCRLFIGAGGTMTRELAVLGFPVISVYQDELLSVDKCLLNEGLMYHSKHLTLPYVEEILKNHHAVGHNLGLMSKGEEAYKMILKTIYESLDRVQIC